MTELTAANVESIIAASRANAAAFADSWKECFGTACRVQVGECAAWQPDLLEGGFDGPGLAISSLVGGQGMVCLIPSRVGLPDWIVAPSLAQASLLNTLAMEWAMSCLPFELEPSEYSAAAVANLLTIAECAEPVDWAKSLELQVFEDATPGDAEQLDRPTTEPTTEPIAKCMVVWPLANPPFQVASGAGQATDSDSVAVTAAAVPNFAARIRQLRGLPVPAIVRLAEKKIEIGQLMGLAPGSLIAFNKPCEDLLDLYVNNRLYCRGEAVKIGEKFGLKINEVGSTVVREESVFNV